MGNAVQHGAPENPVRLTVQAEGEQFSAVVKNWGKPIARNSLEIIFNPLVRMTKGESQQPERPTSLGLGLFIAREIVIMAARSR